MQIDPEAAMEFEELSAVCLFCFRNAVASRRLLACCCGRSAEKANGDKGQKQLARPSVITQNRPMVIT